MVLNKSVTYIFPLIHSYISREFDFDNDFIQYIRNGYVFNREENQFVLLLENNEDTEEFVNLAQESSVFDNMYNKLHNTAIVFNIPEEAQEAYDSFINGKYSEFSNTSKGIVLDFANSYFGRDVYDIITRVFGKDDYLKNYWMDKLGLDSFPDDLEVSSIIDVEKETYIGNNLKL